MLCIVNLSTLNELTTFWIENRQRYAFAASINDYQWIFGATKHSVVKALLKWDQSDAFISIREDRRDWYVVNAGGLTKFDLLGPASNQIDLSSSIELVTTQILDATFDNWRSVGASAYELVTGQDIDRQIEYWNLEKSCGRDYYGVENQSDEHARLMA